VDRDARLGQLGVEQLPQVLDIPHLLILV
jgi:hypothetical protein